MFYIGKMSKRSLQCVLICLMAFTVMVMFCVEFYSDSGVMEAFLRENLSYSFEIMDTHYFSRYSETKYSDRYITYYNAFVSSLRQLAQEPEVSYFNFNPTIEVTYQNVHFYTERIMNSTVTEYNLLTGINDAGFQFRENLEISEGRMISQEEIENGSHVILLSENAYIEENGKVRKAAVGDVVTVIYTSLKYIPELDDLLFREEYTVVGIYKSDYVFDRFYGRYDQFINGDNTIIPADIILNNLSRYIYGLNYEIGEIPFISHISYEAESYDDYQSLKEKMNGFIQRYNQMPITETATELVQSSISTNSMNLELKEQNIENLIRVISRINDLNHVSRFMLLAIIAILFLLVLYHIQKNNIRNVFILYSLGMSKEKIINLNVLQQLLETIIAIVSGCFAGVILSSLSVRMMISQNVMFHNRLVELTKTGTSVDLSGYAGIDLSGSFLQAILKSSETVFVLVLFSTVITLVWVLQGNIKDNLNGGK